MNTPDYRDFLDQRDVSPLPNPRQLRQWVRDKAHTPLRPCHSPYCECDFDKCTHPGCYDARHIPFKEETK